LSLAPPGHGPTPCPPNNGNKEKVLVQGPFIKGDKKPLFFQPTEDDIVLQSQADLENLRKLLERNDRPYLHVLVDNPILDLTDNSLVFNGKEMLIEAMDSPATLKFRYQGNAEDPGRRGGLLIASGKKVVFRNLRFEIEAKVTPKVLVAGVIVRHCEVVSF